MNEIEIGKKMQEHKDARERLGKALSTLRGMQTVFQGIAENIAKEQSPALQTGDFRLRLGIQDRKGKKELTFRLPLQNGYETTLVPTTDDVAAAVEEYQKARAQEHKLRNCIESNGYQIKAPAVLPDR